MISLGVKMKRSPNSLLEGDMLARQDVTARWWVAPKKRCPRYSLMYPNNFWGMMESRQLTYHRPGRSPRRTSRTTELGYPMKWMKTVAVSTKSLSTIYSTYCLELWEASRWLHSDFLAKALEVPFTSLHLRGWLGTTALPPKPYADPVFEPIKAPHGFYSFSVPVATRKGDTNYGRN